MANDKVRKMKLKTKTKPEASRSWDGPQSNGKRKGKRVGDSRRKEGTE